MTHSEAQVLIDYIRKQKYNPNDWELNFMQSIENSTFEKLTFKQTMALEKIYAKSTGGSAYQGRQRIR